MKIGHRHAHPVVLLFFLAALLCLAPASPAAALDVNLRVGAGETHDGDDMATSFGLSLLFDVPGPVNLELSGDYWTEETGGGSYEATVLPLQASIILYPLPFPLIKPYVLAGAGLVFADLSEKGGAFSDKASLFALHAAGGLDLVIGPLGGIKGELRYTSAGSIEAAALPGGDYSPGGWRVFASAYLSF